MIALGRLSMRISTARPHGASLRKADGGYLSHAYTCSRRLGTLPVAPPDAHDLTVCPASPRHNATLLGCLPGRHMLYCEDASAFAPPPPPPPPSPLR